MVHNKGGNWKPLWIRHVFLEITFKYDSPKISYNYLNVVNNRFIAEMFLVLDAELNNLLLAGRGQINLIEGKDKCAIRNLNKRWLGQNGAFKMSKPTNCNILQSTNPNVNSNKKNIKNYLEMILFKLFYRKKTFYRKKNLQDWE